MGLEAPVREGPCRFSPPGGTADRGHGPQTSDGRYVGVTTHWSGAVNFGTGEDRGIYHPPQEHGCAIHFDSTYNVLVFGGGAEAGNSPIQEMVGTARPGYHGDLGEVGSHGGGGGDKGGRI